MLALVIIRSEQTNLPGNTVTFGKSMEKLKKMHPQQKKIRQNLFFHVFFPQIETDSDDFVIYFSFLVCWEGLVAIFWFSYVFKPQEDFQKM